MKSTHLREAGGDAGQGFDLGDPAGCGGEVAAGVSRPGRSPGEIQDAHCVQGSDRKEPQKGTEGGF